MLRGLTAIAGGGRLVGDIGARTFDCLVIRHRQSPFFEKRLARAIDVEMACEKALAIGHKLVIAWGGASQDGAPHRNRVRLLATRKLQAEQEASDSRDYWRGIARSALDAGPATRRRS
jgi:hypothetical protein